MISYDVRCSKDHVFESWFRDSKTFDRQRRKAQVVCPICGDTTVEKALMAPNVSTSKDRSAARREVMAAQTMKFLATVRKQVEDAADYVGPAFAEEAKKIHHGESEQRDIYGEATPEEAEDLRDEGIEFAEIPWVPRADN